MHEHTLIKSLLHKIDDIALQQTPKRIQHITITLGALSHISAEHFREHFEQAVANTPLQSVALTVECETDIHANTAQDIILKSIDFVESE